MNPEESHILVVDDNEVNRDMQAGGTEVTTEDSFPSYSSPAIGQSTYRVEARLLGVGGRRTTHPPY